jgi:hypothetical protein
MSLITTKGDDGHGCYTGCEITIHFMGGFRIPLFWHTFFANELSKEHDAACDQIDWVDPEASWDKYEYATRKFVLDCLSKAAGNPKFITQTVQAEWFCWAWGHLRYGAAMAGYNFQSR